MRSLLGEISSEMPVAYVGTGISLEISPADSRQQLTLSLCLGNKAVKYQFLVFNGCIGSYLVRFNVEREV